MPEPRLEVRDSVGRRIVLLDKPIFTIGRRSSSDLSLNDTEISREHAEIARVDDRYVVRDRGSRYGTFVNAGRVSGDYRLAHGDYIRLGRAGEAQLRFLVDADPVTTPEASAIGGFRHVAALLEALQALGGARVLDEVLALVLDTAIEVTAAERGFIMLPSRRGLLELKLARGRGAVSLPGTSFETSHKIPEEVFASGRDKIVTDLRDGDLAGAHNGTVALGIRHVLCVPLRVVRYVDRVDQSVESRAIGVLYLDSREKGTLLSGAARAALATLAVEAASAIENARLYRETLEKERIEEELRIASQIQQALLPAPCRSGGFFDVAAISIPCRTIGGDFFDYIDLPDHRFGFALGDVAGKGTPAALLTAVLHGILSGQTTTMHNPGETMARVNGALLTRPIDGRFVTAFLGVLGPDGRLAYCNAGHNPPFVFGDGVPRRLTTGGTVLGLFPEARYEQEVVQLAAGDTVLLFSDGLSEALNAAGEEFGDDGIAETVRAALAGPPHPVVQALLAAVKRFAGEALQHDDVTVLALRYKSGELSERSS
jgi:serine phosphatase RsbU (regulator of sigma subunit)